MIINENKQRLYCIDILKGICSIFVIITHYNWQETERLKFLFPFWIDMAVPVFMIISGYLYAKSYKKKEISNIGSAYLLENILNKNFQVYISIHHNIFNRTNTFLYFDSGKLE